MSPDQQDKIDRMAALGAKTIRHSRLTRGRQWLAEIRDVHLRRKELGTPVGEAVLIVGPTGSGKSTILEQFLRDHRKTYGDAHPILPFRLPVNCTPKQLLQTFAHGLGDPLAMTGTVSRLTAFIPQLAASRGISMVAIEECQHLYGRTKFVTNFDAADTIKVLIDEVRVPFVLVGLPDLEEILSTNKQLERRKAGQMDLHAFDMADEDDFKEYVSILEVLDRQLPLERRSNLSSKPVARAIHAASDGLIGRFVPLIHLAARRAIAEDQPRVAIRHLAIAYDELASKEQLKKPNPFASPDLANAA